MSVDKSIRYYAATGPDNTEDTLQLAKARADALGITNIVVASTRGHTGVKAVNVFKGCTVVVVPHVTGMRGPGVQELSEDLAEQIRAGGGKIVIAAHAFSGVNRAIQTKYNTMYPAGIIAQTLRMFGQGMKVVVEIAAMAVDAGLIPADADVIVIAGTGKGADTAVVMKPDNSRNLFDIAIQEIIAKPHQH
jgi:hypothetical protein